MALPPLRAPLSVLCGYSSSHVRALYHAARARARKMYGERVVRIYQVCRVGKFGSPSAFAQARMRAAAAARKARRDSLPPGCPYKRRLKAVRTLCTRVSPAWGAGTAEALYGTLTAAL